MIFKSPYIKLSKRGVDTYNDIYSQTCDYCDSEQKLLLSDVLDFQEYCYRAKKKWYHKLIEKIFKVEILSRV